MFFNILLLLFIFIWNSRVTFQLDFIAVSDSTSIKSHVVKRNVAFDVPEIREFTVKTHVANRFAQTDVLSKVENGDKHAKQTTFSVVLPENAFISGFYMEIDGKTYHAFVKEKKEAEAIYTQHISSGQTAAHVAVNTRNANRFTVNVNVGPESKVNFHLTYEELLQREKGQYEIITNIQPGQIVKKLLVEVEIKESRPLLFVTTPTLRSGNKILKPNVQLDPHASVKISNTTARVKFQPDIDRQLQFACAGLGNKKYDGFAGQFVVVYDIDRDAQGGETLFQDGFFINFFSPPNLEVMSKHIVFVLDTSGSMSGTKIDQLKEAMMSILPQIHSEDVLSIIEYKDEVFLWDSTLTSHNVLPANPNYGNLASQLQITVPEAFLATPRNIDTAKAIVNKFVADSLTNSMGALEVALYLIKLVQEKHPNFYQPIMVFLTDGHPTGFGDTSQIVSLISAINSREYNTPIYSLCIGKDANWDFLQKLSWANSKIKAIRIYVDDDQDSDISLQLAKFYESINNPTLSNVTFMNLPETNRLTRHHFPIFFNGSEITLVGKGASGANPIKVSARGKNGSLELESKIGIPIAKLERVWAYLTVKELIDESISADSQSYKAELEKLALELALNYSLVTLLTSLVVVEPENINTAVNPIDASTGILSDSLNQLSWCDNITNWIITNYGTPQPTTMTTTTEMMTTEPFTTVEPSTTTPTTTTEIVTLGFVGEVIEFDLGIVPTTLPTTAELPVTEKIIEHCKEMPFGCCHDGVTPAQGFNFSGCDPIPTSESCSLLESAGNCSNRLFNKYSIKWAYNQQLGECRQFFYAGCGGNGNRFSSKEVCDKTCVTPSGPDRCKLPIVLGSSQRRCGSLQLNWFYDQKNDECVKYMYSGCYGNSNRFSTKYECQNLCVSPSKRTKPQEVCVMPEDPGSCSNYDVYYFYDVERGMCRQFWYGGCGGNENRFKTLEACKRICISPEGRDVCYLPVSAGKCAQSHKRWFFDKEKQTCSRFTYHCYGNKNNFGTREDCHKTCISGSSVDLQESCVLKHDPGRACTNPTIKYRYSNKKARCVRFRYGGCEGNDNRFDTEQKCKDVCVNPPGKAKCNLPKAPGATTCKQNLTRWYYNKKKTKCETFIYSGCFGNNNNFLSLSDCNTTCV